MSATAVLADILRRHRLALAVLGVLALVAGAWTAASAYAGTREERRTETSTPWAERASYAYAVPITRNSTHLPIGTVLSMGEPAYFRTVSERILVDFAWEALARDDAEGVAAATMVVEIRAQTGEGRPYWTIEHTLAQARVASLAEPLALHGELDLDALVSELQTVSRELPPGEGVVNWTVRTTVVYAVDVAGRAEQDEVEFLLPLQVQDPRFVLPGPDALAWERPHAEQRVVSTLTQAGWAGVFGSPPTLVLPALGLALLLAAGAASAPPRDAFERECRRYRDWVSVAGSVPAPTGTLVDVSSLADLVHVASDARTRVLLDSGSRVFYALLPGVTYRYAGHGAASGRG